jgi:hypothetical protein
VKEFNYLGLLLTKTGNFKRAIKTLADKGTKAMYEILKRGKFHNLSIPDFTNENLCFPNIRKTTFI